MPSHTPGAPQPVPVFEEVIGGALIDAARITVMAAAREFASDAPQIILPGDEQTPTIQECLLEAMQWLDAARVLALEQTPEALTSLHKVHP